MNTNLKMLGICVPTWNRSALLSKSLENILDQIEAANLHKDVEVSVSDNGSSDDTPKVIQEMRSKFPDICVKSHRFAENQGFARNMDTAIRNSTSEFIFLIGDDDAFVPGGICSLLQQCSSINRDVVFIRNYQDKDGTMNSEYCNSMIANQVTVFPTMLEFLLAIGRFFPTYISNFLFRRTAYLQNMENRFLDSIYPHTAVLYKMLRNCEVEFRNFECVSINADHRRVGAGIPRGVCIDLAKIQTEGVSFRDRSSWDVLMFYKSFLMSIPRAILHEKTKACPRQHGDYTDTSFANVLSSYKHSIPSMAAAALLLCSSRLLPAKVLKRILDTRQQF